MLADTIRHLPQPLRLRARWVVPISRPPIENGEIIIEEGRIVSVGKAYRRIADDDYGHVDLGHCAILPGFVNTHTQMEQAVLRGFLEETDYFEWNQRMTLLKTHVGLDDWIASATFGAAEMLSAGFTTVADVSESSAGLSALLISGLRGIAYRSVVGIEPAAKDENVLSVLSQRILNMQAQIARIGADERVSLGIAPESPMTVRHSLFMPLSEFARKSHLPVQIRIGETQDESELLFVGTGKYAEYLRSRNVVWEAPQTSSVGYVAACGGFESPTVASQCVHVDAMDAQLLKIKEVSVAHCPRSNGRLGAGFMPLSLLRDAGLHIGLGTDGLAQSHGVDMFEEMRTAISQSRGQRRAVSALSARDVLAMATLSGARCLGLDSVVGSLEVGKRADLCAITLDGLHFQPTAEDDPISALVYSGRASDVLMTMVEGNVVYERGRTVLLDSARLRSTLAAIRQRLRQVKAFHVAHP